MRRFAILSLAALAALAASAITATKEYVDRQDMNTLALANAYTDAHAGAAPVTNAAEFVVAEYDRTNLTARIGAKQDVIADLGAIRSGAAAGATAVQPSAISDMETKTHAAATYQPKGDYLTEETDPTVPSWAKEPTPPQTMTTNAVKDITRPMISDAANSATNYTDTATNALDTALRGEIAAATNGIRKVDGSARPLPRYLHALDFADSYPLDAEDWYELMATNALGGCSAMRAGGRLRRNYDWMFDDAAEFVVKMSAGENRLASVGVASLGSGLTEDEVTSGKWSKKYRALPGMTLDGINERGVVAEINVDGGPTNGWHGTGANALHILAAVRWVLDHGTNAATAAASIADRIKCPTSGMNFHFMVADERETWIVENGVAHDITTNTWKVLTNFALFDAAHAGGGKERYEVITNGSIPWDAVNFTHAYEPGNDWDSDFESHEQHLEAIRQWAEQGADKEAHRGKTTAGGSPWWQTVHTSIYDFAAKTLRVAVQESADFYTFQVPAVGGGEPYVPSAITDGTNTINANLEATVLDRDVVSAVTGTFGGEPIILSYCKDTYPGFGYVEGWRTEDFDFYGHGLNLITEQGGVRSPNRVPFLCVRVTDGGSNLIEYDMEFDGDTIIAKLDGEEAGRFLMSWSMKQVATKLATTNEVGAVNNKMRYVNVSDDTIQIGHSASANDNYATALGYNATANGYGSTALGDSATANGFKSTALGFDASASGEDSIALGNKSKATAFGAIAIGYDVKAEGINSTALGHSASASGYESTALGSHASASGYGSALGHSASANGSYATALGSFATASGSYATALGFYASATDEYSTVIGNYHSRHYSHGVGSISLAAWKYDDGQYVFTPDAVWIGETNLTDWIHAVQYYPQGYEEVSNTAYTAQETAEAAQGHSEATRAMISATDETFSAAVLGVGLNIDPTTLQWLKDIGAIAGSTTGQVGLGTLLAALLAALMWLKANKVQTVELDDGSISKSSDNGVVKLDDFFGESNSLLTGTIDARLPYPLNTDGTIKDRAVNEVTSGAFVIPEGFHDLLIRYTGVPASLTFSGTDASIADYGDDLPTETGDYLITVTRTKAAECYIRIVTLEARA